jgi:hypothetical protein
MTILHVLPSGRIFPQASIIQALSRVERADSNFRTRNLLQPAVFTDRPDNQPRKFPVDVDAMTAVLIGIALCQLISSREALRR